MTEEVTITDASFVKNEVHVVEQYIDLPLTGKKELNPLYIKMNIEEEKRSNGRRSLIDWPNFGKPVLLPMVVKNRAGGTVKAQSPDPKELTFSGRRLELMIARAKRFLRNARKEDVKSPPRHIVYALMAFAKSAPEEFNAQLSALRDGAPA